MTEKEKFDAWANEYGQHSNVCAWPAWQAATLAERERSRPLLVQARDALELASNSLGWFWSSYPQDVNGSDYEAMADIDKAIVDLSKEVTP